MDFCARKEAVLFATDLAGRGLDFPEVDWVIQLDCPEVRIAPPRTVQHADACNRRCMAEPACAASQLRPPVCVILFVAGARARGSELMRRGARRRM